MEEFVSLGKWWLPNNPEVVVAGKLSFSPISGAKLELIGSFYESPFEETGKVKDLPSTDKILLSEELTITEETTTLGLINPEEIIILGLLETNEKVTLYKCFGSIKTFQLIERSNFLFDVTYIFRKIHFKTEQAIKFNSLSVQYPNFEEWIGKSGVQAIWSPEENKIWISYQPPSCIPLAKFEEIDLSITFSQIYINPSFERYFGLTYYKRNIEQKTFLNLNNPQKKSLDKCVEIIIHFCDFLTFAMSKPSSISAVTGNVDVSYEKPILNGDGSYFFEEETREIQVNILFAVGNFGNNSETKAFLHEMLFIYNDIEGRLGEIFEQWLNKKEVYESVFELFMTTMYTSNLYLHYGFLNMIQALEVYHGNKYQGKYQEEEIYKNGIYNKLLKVVENFSMQSDQNKSGISEDFKKALKGKLNFLNEHSLQTRLGEILKDVTCLLPDNFIGGENERSSFISKASNTRHALAHHDKKQKKKAAKGQELFQLFHTLKVILQCCLLRELSFTDESIKELVERNRNYSKEWRPQKISIQLSDKLSIKGYIINGEFRPTTTETSVLLGYKEKWLNKLLNSKGSPNLKNLQSKGFTGDIKHPVIEEDGEIGAASQIKTISLRDFLKLIFFERAVGNKQALTIISILTKMEQQTLEEKRNFFGLTYDEFIGALAENQTELEELRLSGDDLYDTEEVDEDKEAKEDLNS
jgi:hypothetical protein